MTDSHLNSVEINDIVVEVSEDSVEQIRVWASEIIQKNNLATEHQNFLSEKCFRRYLIARRGDIDAVKANILSTLKWRSEHIRKPCCCPTCQEIPNAHCFVPIGWDGHGNPVIYGCPAKAANTNVEETVHHVTHSLELSFENSSLSDQWVWIVDFKGYGFWHAMQARLGISFATIFGQHMPERLCKIILVNPPAVFDILLKAIRPFVDHRTLNKISSLHGTNEEITEVLQRDHNIEEEVLSWLKGTFDMKAIPGNILPIPSRALCMQFPSKPTDVNNGDSAIASHETRT